MDTDILIEVRKDNNLKQKDMAKLLVVKQPTYSHYERGVVVIPLEKLNIVANKFDVSLDYLTQISRSNNSNFKHIHLNKKIIGMRLKEIRVKNGFSQEDIAMKLNTVHSCISDYETGKTMIPTLFMIAFAKLTHSSVDFICGKID